MHRARLVVPFRLPASRNVGGRAREASFVPNLTPVLTQFSRLEWLILAPTSRGIRADTRTPWRFVNGWDYLSDPEDVSNYSPGDA
ncbi:hypothetical protein FNAPI_7662 [Fusarium napiforme]|uniref:Uncharacterized protein n=1 Tax=Fusarium napiforme TaxID=42672 RepID=A0A8H5J950_9HYPO|nr:hypothetical protein FNAPI_7662 [Fusarium napiforme]